SKAPELDGKDADSSAAWTASAAQLDAIPIEPEQEEPVEEAVVHEAPVVEATTTPILSEAEVDIAELEKPVQTEVPELDLDVLAASVPQIEIRSVVDVIESDMMPAHADAP